MELDVRMFETIELTSVDEYRQYVQQLVEYRTKTYLLLTSLPPRKGSKSTSLVATARNKLAVLVHLRKFVNLPLSQLHCALLNYARC